MVNVTNTLLEEERDRYSLTEAEKTAFRILRDNGLFTDDPLDPIDFDKMRTLDSEVIIEFQRALQQDDKFPRSVAPDGVVEEGKATEKGAEAIYDENIGIYMQRVQASEMVTNPLKEGFKPSGAEKANEGQGLEQNHR